MPEEGECSGTALRTGLSSLTLGVTLQRKECHPQASARRPLLLRAGFPSCWLEVGRLLRLPLRQEGRWGGSWHSTFQVPEESVVRDGLRSGLSNTGQKFSFLFKLVCLRVSVIPS